MGSERLYRHTGVVLVRATTADPGGLELPEDMDLCIDDSVVESGRAWLARLWLRGEVRVALRVASPVLSRQIDAALSGGHIDARQMRRVIVSTCSYLLRWQRRATPFGLFAGVAAGSVGDEPTVWFGRSHRVVVRADAQWLSGLIDGLERNPGLLPRLPVVVNSAGFVRGDRFVVPVRSGDVAPGREASLEFSARHTRPVRAALAGAVQPVQFGKLARQLCGEFPTASLDKINTFLAELVAHHILLTSLRAPMTTVDGLAHLVEQLEVVGGADLPDVAVLLKELTRIYSELSQYSRSVVHSEIDPAIESVAKPMKAICDTADPTVGHVIAVDVELDCQLTVPEAVLREAEATATALLRLTSNPFGSPSWKDFHVRFRDFYGAGAVVPVRDVVADSGLGLPTEFLGAPRGHAVRALAERDEKLLALIQQAVFDGRREIELTEPVIRGLAVGDHAEMIPPPRVELAFQLHAACTDTLARGQFQLWVTGAPRPASSMAGRFAYLLSEVDRRCLADSYALTGSHAVAAQLSFPPRREHNQNIARVPRLLPHVISVSEHRSADSGLIDLDDLAVTADASQLYLVQLSTGAQIHPQVLHALEASVQTPPLARFLAEVASARCGVYGPFDFGAARTLPFLPRMRHGRAVLAPARWLLAADELPAPGWAMPAWEKKLSAWRDRWRVPSAVVLRQGELRLPLDLDDRLHRVLLRTRLDRAGRIELREVGDPSDLGWVGRACELLVPLTLARPQVTGDRPRTELSATVARANALLPGHSALLHAQLFGHPMRFDEILTDHLSRLLNEVADHTVSWWFRRHHDTTRPDTDHHLGLYLRLPGPEDYGSVARLLADWVAELSALGLLAHLSLGTYQPQNGRYGHGATMAAENVFAADSAAALAEIMMATRAGIPSQAIAAVSLADLAACFATVPEVGWRWLIKLLPQEQGKLDQSLRDATLLLTSTPDARTALSTHPSGEIVAGAWDHRRVALVAYREQLAGERDPATVLRSLLHDHHVRAVGVDPDREQVTNRLARAAALRQIALLRRRTP